MADGRFISYNTSGDLEENQAINTTTGVADANKLLRTNSAGKLAAEFLPASEEAVLEASESIDAGDAINIFDDAGTSKIRKADASASAEAHGFVIDAVTLGANGTIYGEGICPGSGHTAGDRLFLSATTPGAFTTTVVAAGSGHIIQELGFAISANEIMFERNSVGIRES